MMETRQTEINIQEMVNRIVRGLDSEMFKTTKFEMNKFSALFFCEYKVEILLAFRTLLASVPLEIVDTVSMSFVLMVARKRHCLVS